jgi:hypothetical protein
MGKADQIFDEVLAVMSGDAAQRLEDQINAYADSKSRADKQARHTGGPQHDTDCIGRILKAGS